MLIKRKFEFYEIVRISSDDPKHKYLTGCLGVVRGMVQNENTGDWIYGISLKKEKECGEIWRFYETQLCSTGKKAKPEDFITDQSVKVRVNHKSGKGEIVDEE